MKILAVGAHPDDIEIFMYGYLANMSKKFKIELAVATDGAMGGNNQNNSLVKKRKLEAKRGLSSLGSPHFFNLPDGRLHDYRLANKVITDHLNKIKPDIILTHDPKDYHPDHRAISKLMMNEVGFKCPMIFSDTLMGVSFTPDFYVDITEYFEAKKKSILKHQSQNPRKLLEAVKIWNRFRSAQCNAPTDNYAECYRFLKRFPFLDMRQFIPPAPKYRPFNIGDNDSLI